MKKYFSFYWGRVLFSSLFLGVFMMSPVFAGTIYTPTSNGSLGWATQVNCPANNYTCVNELDNKWRKETNGVINVTDTFYFSVPNFGSGAIIDNVEICLWSKNTSWFCHGSGVCLSWCVKREF